MAHQRREHVRGAGSVGPGGEQRRPGDPDERLAEVKDSRSATDVSAALGALEKAAAQDDVNLMPLLVECAKAYCTLGEMVDVLKNEWGEFVQPTVF